MRLLSLFGLDARIRRVQIAAGESAIAAGDRAQLVRLAWEEEKQRLKRMLVLTVSALGLTAIVIALLSLAVIVHFWDTPHRVTAAWSVAGVWVVVWLGCVLALRSALSGPSAGVLAARKTFGDDWDWAQARFGLEPDESSARERPQPTRDELLARIERQRLRIATLQAADPATAPDSASAATAAPPPDESAPAAALRIARAHPVATGVAAAVAVVVFKPRRLLRWTAFIAPILWRMR